MLQAGVDPIEHKRGEAEQRAVNSNSFEFVAREWHTAMLARWSPDHGHRILLRLEQNLFAPLGARPIVEIKTKELIELLLTIQNRGADLAGRMQQVLVGIFRFAVQRDLISYNPAQDLAGCLIPPKSKHRPALQLDRLPELLKRIADYDGRAVTRIALIVNAHVFVRSSELRFARWPEFDLGVGLWTIPPEREPIEGVRYSVRGAKMKTPHLVPLSRQAVEILKSLRELTGAFDLVFPGDHRYWKPLSENTVNHALARMGYDTKIDICGHGFRTMACSALNESGRFSRDAVERQMSHQERDGVRAAYMHKAEFIAERRQMMQWWSDYLDANQGSFVPPYDFKN
jgi:integrase